MSYHLKVKTKDVHNLLTKAGFQIGFVTVAQGTTHEALCTYYFLDNAVVLVDSITVFVDCIRICNTADTMFTFTTSMTEFKESLISNIKALPHVNAPSIINTFQDILFYSFDNADDKLNKLTSVLPQFHPDFAAIFKPELDAMSSTTDIKASFKMYDTLIKDDGRIFYVAGVSDDRILVKDVNESTSIGLTCVSVGEISNGSTWRMTDGNAYKTQLYGLFTEACSLTSILFDRDKIAKVTGFKLPDGIDYLFTSKVSSVSVVKESLDIVLISNNLRIKCCHDSWYVTFRPADRLSTKPYAYSVDELYSFISYYGSTKKSKSESLVKSLAALVIELVDTFEFCLYGSETLFKLTEWANQVYDMAVNSDTYLEQEEANV